MPFHLYLHLPYCRRRCPYCDFFKRIPLPGERERFVESLLSEMSIHRAKSTIFDCKVATVYFGGGTPSLHPPSEIDQMLQKIEKLWGMQVGTEITLEANPGTLNLESLQGWRKGGINRLSLGVQSFSERKLQVLYRDHTVLEAKHAVELARSAGFDNLSLDLIFGLPGETAEEWRQDILQTLAFEPEHISLYNLEYHEGTPFSRWRENGRLMPLSDDIDADLYLLTHDVLTQAGYVHYEISNFARPGKEAVHNSAYWSGKPYLGLGPSAHSFDGLNTRWRNFEVMPLYQSSIANGMLPIVEINELTVREQQEEWITLHLRRNPGLDFRKLQGILGEETAMRFWQKAENLPADLRIITPQNLSLTPAGWFREDSIFLFLFEALA